MVITSRLRPHHKQKDKGMKRKEITGIVTLGIALALGLPIAAGADPAVVTPAPQTYPAATAPAAEVPAGYVWDGSEYVGKSGSKYYYLGPQNTWVALDKTRQNRFQDWQKKNPDWKSHEVRNTRYQGHDMGQSHAVAPNPTPPPQENPHSP
jgi:hypothetical protein